MERVDLFNRNGKILIVLAIVTKAGKPMGMFEILSDINHRFGRNSVPKSNLIRYLDELTKNGLVTDDVPKIVRGKRIRTYTLTQNGEEHVNECALILSKILTLI